MKMLVLNLQDACWSGFSVCEKLQEAARRKLWLLAKLSGILEPFGVKIVCGRAFSETVFSQRDLVGLRTSSACIGQFSDRYLLYTESQPCRLLGIFDLGRKFQPVHLRVCQELIFFMSMSVFELVAVDSLYNEHREINVSESTICGIPCDVTKVCSIDVFLRSCVGGR